MDLLSNKNKLTSESSFLRFPTFLILDVKATEREMAAAISKCEQIH